MTFSKGSSRARPDRSSRKSGFMERIGKADYYLNIALEVSRRGTCLRRNYGAVIVNHDEMISAGYTGAPRGTRNCSDIRYCARSNMGVPSGERYELCRSVHAEMNAIIHASRREALGGTMYLMGVDMEDGRPLQAGAEPCRLCKRVIINAGLNKVVTRNGNGDVIGHDVRDWVTHEDQDYGIVSPPESGGELA